VKSQICIVVSVYVLVAIVKKMSQPRRLALHIATVFSLTPFEEMFIQQEFTGNDYIPKQGNNSHQLDLFAF
jgi:hypothetical protein